MVSRKEDYSYLLDDLREISQEYHWDVVGRVVDNNGVEQNDEVIITKTDFYMGYCFAYRAFEQSKDNTPIKVDRAFIERALSSYGAFNYLINTCLGEYRVYNTVGTGKVSYVPYQALADHIFNYDLLKDSLINYLKQELSNVFEEENTYKKS